MEKKLVNKLLHIQNLKLVIFFNKMIKYKF